MGAQRPRSAERNKSPGAAVWLSLLGVVAAGCSNFGRFEPYQPRGRAIAGAAKHRVRLNVWNAPDDFTIYRRDEHPQKYARKPIDRYIKEGLRSELTRAGFAAAAKGAGDGSVVVVDAYVNQFDLGYEKVWWTTGILFFGYSRVSVLAIADLTVEVTLPGGERYRRRFVARAEDRSRLLWTGPFVPILPIPISGFYDEAAQVARVSGDCFSRVVASVNELIRARVASTGEGQRGR